MARKVSGLSKNGPLNPEFRISQVHLGHLATLTMTTMEPCAIDTEMFCDFSVFYHLLFVLFSLEDSGEVHGSLSVLLDSAMCAIAPILLATTQVPEMDGCSQKTQVLTAL